MTKQRHDLFLDYSRTDIQAVQVLASELSDVGIDVWFDQWELIPGQDWSRSLEEAISNREPLVFVSDANAAAD